MYQILIGQTAFDGSPISNCSYYKTIDSESIDYEEMTKLIVEGLQAMAEALIDTSIIDSLNTTPISTIYDLLSLQFNLKTQKIDLIVTKINESVIDSSMNLMVKVISPMRDQFGIPKSIDFPFLDQVDMYDVIKESSNSFDLFNSSIFVSSPINELIHQVPSLEESGLPSREVISEAMDVMIAMGFTIKSIFINV